MTKYCVIALGRGKFDHEKKVAEFPIVAEYDDSEKAERDADNRSEQRGTGKYLVIPDDY